MLFANFLIGLREGREASMVVMILVAFLVKGHRRDQLRWVWIGVGAALAATVTAFLVIQLGTKTLTSQGQELVGGIASLVAVALGTWMLLWMRGPFAVIVVAFTAVIREGIETALLVFDSFTSGALAKPFLGLALGMVTSVVLAVLMYRGAVKINLKTFFTFTGVLLVIVAAGILRYGITDLQEAGVLPGLNNIAFDISAILPPGSTAATLIEGIFNLVPAPTVASMVAWAIYLVVALWLFLRPEKTTTQKAPKAVAVPA